MELSTYQLRIRLLCGAAAIIVAVLNWPSIARAGPPFVTDDPEPVELGHYELDLAGQFRHDRSGDSAQLPSVEFDYGIFKDTELHIVAPYAYDRERGEESHFGYGDTELGIKYRFIQESERVPQVAIAPAIQLPTGDSRRGLGNGRLQVFIPIWAQKGWGKWTTYGGGGFGYNPGPANKNFWFFGWALEREINEHLMLGGELFHQTRTTIGGDPDTGFNVGGALNFGEHYHVHFSAGRDISGPNLFSCYLGLQITF